MSDKPATSPLLSADELDSIRALHKSAHAKGMPFDSYADATETVGALLMHLDATRQAVAEQLRKLLYNPDVLTQLEPADQVQCILRNNEVLRAARALQIDLTPRP